MNAQTTRILTSTAVALALLASPVLAGEIRSQQDAEHYAWHPAESEQLPDLPASTPTLELPMAVHLPPALQGCFRGESVFEDATRLYGKGDPDIATSTVTTVCYTKLPSGRYQLKLNTAIQDMGKTAGLTSLTGALLKSHLLKVNSQLSDVQLEAVPQDDPERFVVKERAKVASAISLVGLHGEADTDVSLTTRCQMRSNDWVHCQTEEYDTDEKTSWEVLSHSHVEFYRISAEIPVQASQQAEPPAPVQPQVVSQLEVPQQMVGCWRGRSSGSAQFVSAEMALCFAPDGPRMHGGRQINHLNGATVVMDSDNPRIVAAGPDWVRYTQTQQNQWTGVKTATGTDASRDQAAVTCRIVDSGSIFCEGSTETFFSNGTSKTTPFTGLLSRQ
ncbi:MAG: hypothetical protein JO121_09545 [Deltaproteobacteria bacterium]|nr:hypothetical protein [Deltaproteobacteria bacterium]